MAEILNLSKWNNVHVKDLSEEDKDFINNFADIKSVRFSFNRNRNGTPIWFSISNLQIEDGKRISKPKNLSQVLDAISKKRLYWVAPSGDVKQQISGETLNNLIIVPAVVPSTIVSDRVNPDGSTSFVGLNRLLEQKSEESGKFVYLNINGNWQFVNRSAVGYYDGATFKNLSKVKQSDLNSILARDLYLSEEYDNKPVKEIVANYYSLDYVRDAANHPVMDSISADGLRIKKYAVNQYGNGFVGKVGADGKFRYTVNVLQREKMFNEQEFTMMEERALMETKIYQAVANQKGEYIRLNVKGQSEPIAVCVKGDNSQLWLPDESGRPSVKIDYSDEQQRVKIINSIIGKELLIKMPDGSQDKFLRTMPITTQQATLTYDTEKIMHRTSFAGDVMANNAYLRLGNGKYVKESEFVRPIAYKYARGDDSEFDAYLCYVSDNSGNIKTIIVPKSVTAGRYGGYSITPDNMVRIKKSLNPLKECDVIQTTNNGEKVEQCVTLTNRPVETKKSLKAEPKQEAEGYLQNAIEQFRAEYARGRYAIDNNKVIMPIKQGKKTVYQEFDIETSSDGKFPVRYVYTDKLYTDDTTHENYKYKYLENRAAQIDEKTGKLKYGPKINTGKAIKNFYKGYGKLGLESAAAFFAGGGLLALLGAPILVAAAAGTYVAAGVAAPIYYAIKGAVLKFKNFADKVKTNRNNVKNKLNNQMQALYQQVSNKIAENNNEREIVEKTHNDRLANLKDYINSKEFKNNSRIQEINQQLELFKDVTNPDIAQLLKDVSLDLPEQKPSQPSENITLFQNLLNECNNEITNLRADLHVIRSSKGLQEEHDYIFANLLKGNNTGRLKVVNFGEDEYPHLAKYLGISIDEFENRYKGANKNKLNRQSLITDIKHREELIANLTSDASKKTEIDGRLQEAYNSKEIYQKILNEITRLEYEREQIAIKQINEEYSTAIEQCNSNLEDIKKFFENECNGEISAQIHMLSETKYNANFEVKNGYADVNEANAAIYSECRGELKRLARKRDKIEKYLQKHPKDASMQAEYQACRDKLNAIINTPKSGQKYPQDEACKEYENKLQLLRTYVGVKLFGGKTNNTKVDAIIKSHELDIASGKVKLEKSKGQRKAQVAEQQKLLTNSVLETKGNVVDADNKTVFANNETLIENVSGHYDSTPKAFAESETPKPKKALTEEQIQEKAKKAEEKEKLKEELKKPIVESEFQQDKLWKVIVYAKDIAQKGENATKDSDFKDKIKIIQKYHGLVDAALNIPIENRIDANTVLEVTVDGKKQQIGVGLLKTAKSNLGAVLNLLAVLRANNKTK